MNIRHRIVDQTVDRTVDRTQDRNIVKRLFERFDFDLCGGRAKRLGADGGCADRWRTRSASHDVDHLLRHESQHAVEEWWHRIRYPEAQKPGE